MKPEIIYLKEDLPLKDFKALMQTDELAVDTELTGLDVHNDRLCLVQLKAKGSDKVYLVQIFRDKSYDKLKELLENPNIVKIFHYARMDLLMLYKDLNIWAIPCFCTKIAVLIARPRKGHTLQRSLKEIMNIELDKTEGLSDWTKTLNEKQIEYAANDVLYLHELKYLLETMLMDQNKLPIAKSCFRFLPTRVLLDLDWSERDIFSHNPK